MKTIFRRSCRVLIFVVGLSLLALFSKGFAADKKPYPTSPPAQAAKKWRIGYYEGGPYSSYPPTLLEIVNNLVKLGWIEPVTIPSQPDEKDASKLWAWLAANIKSSYLEFAADAFYSFNWKRDIRDQHKQIIKRLKEAKDIDLMIAMGTWAGQDLANNDHSVPTVVCSVSDPVASKIITSIEDSGFDHLHAIVDPKKFIRQIYAFHDIIGFKKLGLTYLDTIDGRSYAALDDVKRISQERHFSVLECPMPVTPEANAKMIECVQMLTPKIDAYYLTMQSSVNKETLPKILSTLIAAKVPVFSQAGSDEVRQGALLSIPTFSNISAYGKFHAEVIAKIMNGAKPRELGQVCEASPKIAFNKATAKLIDLRDDVFQLLSKTAQEVYDQIEEPKN